jgi:cytidylate kinase
MKEQIRENPKIVAAAERQMQAWSYAKRLADHKLTAHGPHSLRMTVGPYISISREAGAGGEEVAGRVAQRLGWEVMDKNLLDEVARRYHLSKSRLRLVDETTSNWVHDMLGPWADPQIVPHEKYLVRLARVVRAAAQRGNVIFVGRGAPFLLPRDHGLAVRIIADEKYRVDQTMRSEGLDETAARRRIGEIDRGRREFVQRFFHRNPDDPHLYDLVIRTDRLGVEGAADLIVAAYERLSAAR